MTNRQMELIETILNLMEELDNDLLEAVADDVACLQSLDFDPKRAAFFSNAKT